MLVREPVVSMYVATSGASGQLLGSDEKEIILLVFAVIDAASNTVSFCLIFKNIIFYLIYIIFTRSRTCSITKLPEYAHNFLFEFINLLHRHIILILNTKLWVGIRF